MNVGPVNSGMIAPAVRMKNAVIAPSPISMIQNSVEASRNASLRRSCCEQFGEDRARTPPTAPRWRTGSLTRFGTWKAIV